VANTGYRRALRAVVAGQSRAYGFTLVIWTTGAFALADEGVPTHEDALAYLVGAVAGIAVIVLVAFGDLRASWGDLSFDRRAYGAIHLISVLAGVGCGAAALALVDGVLAFFLGPFVAVVVFDLVMALEVILSVDPDRPRGGE
jgi:hypothetical protein